MAAWRDQNKASEGYIDFYLFATLVPWFILAITAILLVFGILYRIVLINMPFTLMINCLFWAVILLVASIIISTKRKPPLIKAAMGFGFITTAGLVFQAFLHFLEFTVAGGKIRGSCFCCAKNRGDAATR